jgi:hypothetical protein
LVLLATAGSNDSPPGKHWNDPKQIQPSQITKKQPWMMEKQVLLKMGYRGSVVGPQRMSDAANRKTMCDGYAAVRRIPRNGACSKDLPAERQCAKRPDSKTKPAERKQSNCTAAEGQ